MDSRQPPPDHAAWGLVKSARDLVLGLAMNPRMMGRFMADPRSAIDRTSLPIHEKILLKSEDAAQILSLMARYASECPRAAARSLPEGTNIFESSQGRLTVVGTGIDATRHLTAEARAAIVGAEAVFLCVCDPTAEIIVRELNDRVEDLYLFYSEDLPRSLTYARMTDAVVSAVVDGLNVCMVFYGNPAVCVTSTHAAVARVRELGAVARILPSVSAHDALFADLGLDPAREGCQLYEATRYLTLDRSYDVNTPLILFQLSAVGDLNYYTGSFPGICVGLLVDVLRERYGGDHPCVLYEAASMPFLKNKEDRLAIDDLRTAELHATHTLLVPPKGEPPRNESMIERIKETRKAFYKSAGKPTGNEGQALTVENAGSVIYGWQRAQKTVG